MTVEPRAAGFQGALGAFSEEAALRLAPDFRPVPRSTFEDVVQAVESGADDVGVLPVENTLAGTVTEAYDALAAGDVSVAAEAAIPIRHFVLGVTDATLKDLREVRSHPVALAQCRAFLERHRRIVARAVYDTAGAAEEVAAQGDPCVAAIASRRAADRYGLAILEGDVQDRDDNQTRFYLIAPAGAPARDTAGRGSSTDPVVRRPVGAISPPIPTGLKTSLVVELENRAGSLHELLGVFARRGLSLTHVTSRPAPTPWTYRFIVELQHASADEVDAAVDEASELAATLRRLGTFPARQPMATNAEVADPGASASPGPT